MVRAINFIDASETSTSDAIRAVRPELGASTAPSLYMLKTFGELLDINVEAESVVGSSNNFANDLSKRTQGVRESCSYS